MRLNKRLIQSALLISTMAIAACDSEKSDVKGAVNPNSVEAKSLMSNPWCRQISGSNNTRYEIRKTYASNGTLDVDSFLLDSNGERVSQQGQSTWDWLLNGDILEEKGEDGGREVEHSYTVVIEYRNGQNALKLEYDYSGFAQEETYRACD